MRLQSQPQRHVSASESNAKPDDARWNANADINGDGAVDLSDLFVMTNTTTNATDSTFKFVEAKVMAKRIKRTHVGKNQGRILDILNKYEALTARDIAEILWARNIHYKTPEYSSTHRSLAALHKKGLVEKYGGQIKWRKAKKTQ